MNESALRLPLPEPDDSHPLDWYPGDDPESRSMEEAEAWVDAVLTRRGEAENVVKYGKARQAIATPDGLYTTTPGKEIVMPSQRTTPSIMAAVQSVARQLQANPLPPRKPSAKRWGVRRGATRGAGQLSRIYYMQCMDCLLIKVGVSGDYLLRRIELEKRSGHRNLFVLGTEVGDLWCEQQTHDMLWASRATGEWYRPTEAVWAHIRRTVR